MAKAPLERKRRSDAGKLTATIHDEALRYIVHELTRPEKPKFAAAYRRLVVVAAEREWGDLPSIDTIKSRLDVIAPFWRLGSFDLDEAQPYQERSTRDLRPMDIVNADGHKLDLLVDLGNGKVGRVMLTAWQDVHSRAILGWYISKTETADSYRHSFRRMIEQYGLPGKAVMDNSKAARASSITGGAKGHPDQQHVGIITACVGRDGVIHTKPYSGRSKPIERAFRDLAESISKHPALAGCYTGNTPAAKPLNYGERACTIEELKPIVELAVREYNGRKGRRTEASIATGGLSAIEILRSVPNTRPMPSAGLMDQLRYVSASVRANKTNGAIPLHGNRYYDFELCVPLARKPGDKARTVEILYDPDDLSTIQAKIGGEFVTLERINRSGFDSRDDARESARKRRRINKHMQAAMDDAPHMTADEVRRVWEPVIESAKQPPAEPPAERKVVAGPFPPAQGEEDTSQAA